MAGRAQQYMETPEVNCLPIYMDQVMLRWTGLECGGKDNYYGLDPGSENKVEDLMGGGSFLRTTGVGNWKQERAIRFSSGGVEHHTPTTVTHVLDYYESDGLTGTWHSASENKINIGIMRRYIKSRIKSWIIRVI